jgi:hypothetical protein
MDVYQYPLVLKVQLLSSGAPTSNMIWGYRPSHTFLSITHNG